MPESNSWRIDSEHTLKKFQEFIEKEWREKHYLTVKWHSGRTRSSLQNNSLHVYCRMLAKELNAAGLDMRAVIKQDIAIDWSEETVKENLWKPIQKALTKESSTSNVNTKDYVIIYETLNRHLSEKFGISVPWPVKVNSDVQTNGRDFT